MEEAVKANNTKVIAVLKEHSLNTTTNAEVEHIDEITEGFQVLRTPGDSDYQSSEDGHLPYE